ncbi:MAG: hypothetical protein OK456_00325 [Thaumarchaeota archaeon]|nr:hypothetical protein [Nitrososphaerota archaeon]
MVFKPLEFLPTATYSRITDLRLADPDLPSRLARGRTRRSGITKDGRLVMVAADHPGRMTLSIREDPLRMGRRHEFLSRLLRVLACSDFDGLLGTADVVDELFYISSLATGQPRSGFLNGKIMLGSINRGGLAGSAWELDDGPTGYDPGGIASMGLDGAKFLLRVDLGNRDASKTMSYCVDAIRDCNSRNLPIFVEPLPVSVREGATKLEPDPEKLIKLVGAATALSSSSTRMWLKLPYTQRFDEVAASTTLPILLLGGEATKGVSGLLTEVEQAMKAGPNVRGVLLGRNLLYPPGEDPLPLAQAISSIVHRGANAKEAESQMRDWEGRDLTAFQNKEGT